MTIIQQVEELLSAMPLSNRIDLLERLGKKYRRENSARINDNQMRGTKLIDPDRPDLTSMK